jgi:hypothetical protein
MDDAPGTEAHTVSFQLLKYVRSSQGLYGLKHADYKRYRWAAQLLAFPKPMLLT